MPFCKLLVISSWFVVRRAFTANYQLPTHNLPTVLQGQKGFTLIEILIAIAIIGLISAVAIPNLRRFNSENVVNVTTQDMVRLIRQAQSSAASGIKCNGTLPEIWYFYVGMGNDKTYGVNARFPNGSTCYSGGAIQVSSGINTTSSVCSNNSTIGIIFKGNKVSFQCAGVDISPPVLDISVRLGSGPPKVININSAGTVY
jgi:prepilin-type N-terminal cleavage/methylation domain-containing protein